MTSSEPEISTLVSFVIISKLSEEKRDKKMGEKFFRPRKQTKRTTDKLFKDANTEIFIFGGCNSKNQFLLDKWAKKFFFLMKRRRLHSYMAPLRTFIHVSRKKLLQTEKHLWRNKSAFALTEKVFRLFAEKYFRGSSLVLKAIPELCLALINIR